MRRVLLIVSTLVWARSLPACLAPPGYTCTDDQQCDRDEGSVCDIASGRCVASDGDAGDGNADEAGDGGDPGCIASVVAGGETTCVLVVDGSLWCWGDNDARLVDPSNDADAVPSLTMPQPQEAFAAADLGAVGCGVATSGAVRCWGQPVADFESLPTTAVAAVAVGNEALCVGVEEGGVACAAERDSGTPVVPPPMLSHPPDALGIGGEHACALLDGGVTCWGDQRDGRLGNGEDADASAVATVSLPGPATAIAVSLRSSCAIAAGEVLCWGNNDSGTLGITGGARAEPTSVALAGPAETIAAGGKHMCAVLEDASVWCWGDASAGAVDGTRGPDKAPPTRVPGVQSRGSIAAGQGHTCTVAGEASIWCWGSNGCGELAPEQSDQDCSCTDAACDVGAPRLTSLPLCDG